MDELTFWARIWVCIAGVIVALIVSIAGFQAYQTYTIKEMVMSGVDPITAACSTGMSSYTALACVMATQEQTKRQAK